MKRLAFPALLALALSVGGCATPAITTHCTPSSDLPARKEMKKVPETATGIEHLYDLLVDERRDHAADIRDYNSLYSQCVSPSAASPEGSRPVSANDPYRRST